MESSPAVAPPPERDQTPEESSRAPVSRRSAQAGENPRGAKSRPRRAASPGRRPERKSSRMTTVKKTTKAQMLRTERKEFFTAPVKAAVNRSAWNRGTVRASFPRRPPL